MEKLKLNGIGSWGVPSLIRDVLINLWNDLSNKINELIDSVTAIEEDITTIENTINASPKELVYKALLTQTGENTMIPRILNADDEDFLGELSWVTDFVESGYVTAYTDTGKNINYFLPMVWCSNQSGSSYIWSSLSGSNIINVQVYFFNEGDFYVEIRVRIRPEVLPQLLSIETDVDSTKVTVTFSKAMSGYNFENLQSAILIATQNAPNVNVAGAVTLNEEDNTKVDIALTSGLASDDIIYFNYDGSHLWEALDLSLVAIIEDFVVTNNIIAPTA